MIDHIGRQWQRWNLKSSFNGVMPLPLNALGACSPPWHTSAQLSKLWASGINPQHAPCALHQTRVIHRIAGWAGIIISTLQKGKPGCREEQGLDHAKREILAKSHQGLGPTSSTTHSLLSSPRREPASSSDIVQRLGRPTGTPGHSYT